jgi:hypothetical protein
MLPLRDHLPTRSFPVVNYALMAVNVVVFGVEAWLAAGSSGPTSLDEWALVRFFSTSPAGWSRRSPRWR